MIGGVDAIQYLLERAGVNAQNNDGEHGTKRVLGVEGYALLRHAHAFCAWDSVSKNKPKAGLHRWLRARACGGSGRPSALQERLLRVQTGGDGLAAAEQAADFGTCGKAQDDFKGEGVDGTKGNQTAVAAGE